MVRVQLLKSNGKTYVQLPDDLAKVITDDPELFTLKDGFYLLSIPLEKLQLAKPKDDNTIPSDELGMIKKLMAIRFENRTPDVVLSTLSENEKSVLAKLEKKGFVQLFKSKKYPKGVYNISDDSYALVNKVQSEPVLPQKIPVNPTRVATYSNNSYQNPVPVYSNPAVSSSQSLTSFRTQGYMIISDSREASLLSEKLGPEMKRSEIFGTKGFDGKFYIASRSFLTKARDIIIPKLKDDMSIDAIGTACNLDPDGCRVALHILSENGEVIEKRKGIFAAL